MYWRAEGTAARCELCPHHCLLPPGEAGLCGARAHGAKGLEARSYGRVAALALDPVEKKPLRRFHPGNQILSVGGFGCNLRCPFCQNHQIAVGRPSTDAASPRWLAQVSRELADRGNIGVAYTYNEPLVGFEYVLDCAGLVRERGQYNVLVTNGYVEEAPLLELLPYIDAMNIDLKGFSADWYAALGGGLAPVLRTIRTAAARCHVEVTTLIVPGENDDPGQVQALAEWLAAVDFDIPLHLTRFFPRHRMADRAPTAVDEILALTKVARSRLRYVYAGNC